MESESNFHFTNNDLSNENSLNELVDIDVVYHMGARAGVRQSFNDPLSYIKDNTIATTNVANFCKKNDICLLYTSPSPRDISGSRMPSSA